MAVRHLLLNPIHARTAWWLWSCICIRRSCRSPRPEPRKTICTSCDMRNSLEVEDEVDALLLVEATDEAEERHVVALEVRVGAAAPPCTPAYLSTTFLASRSMPVTCRRRSCSAYQSVKSAPLDDAQPALFDCESSARGPSCLRRRDSVAYPGEQPPWSRTRCQPGGDVHARPSADQTRKTPQQINWQTQAPRGLRVASPWCAMLCTTRMDRANPSLK